MSEFISYVLTVFDPARLYNNIRDDDPFIGAGGWLPPEFVPEKLHDNRGIGRAVCATNAQGDLHICAWDGQNILHTIRLADGSWPFGWGNVNDVVAQTPDIRPVRNVACAVNSGGDLHVCAVDGVNGNLWHTIRLADGSWPFPWRQPPQGPNIRLTRPIACATSQTGDLHVCIIDSERNVWHTIRLADGSWPFGWGNVNEVVAQTPDIRPVRNVACGVNSGGDLHVCVVNDVVGNLWHTIRLADGSWPFSWGDVQSQTSLVGPFVNLPIWEVACATCKTTNELHIVVTDIDPNTGGLLWYTRRNADGTWSFFEQYQKLLNVIGSVSNTAIAHTK
jgi:hypothetical protein